MTAAMMSDTLVITSYNLHGFNQGRVGIDELISTYQPDVLLLQEHWLTPANLSKFDCFNQYCPFGSSAMSDTVGAGMLVGRPFGGVMSLVHNRLRPITSVINCADRYVIIKIHDIVIVNIYLPCSSTTNRNFISECIFNEIQVFCDKFIDCKFIFGGDFNANLDSSDVVSSTIFRFLSKYNAFQCDLSCGSKCDKPTYINESLQQSSRIDYIFSSIRDVIDYDVIDLNINFSDHLPVLSTLKCDLTLPVLSQSKSSVIKETVNQLRWDHANLSLYYNFTRDNLEPLWYYINNTSVDNISDASQVINLAHDRIIDTLTKGAHLYVPKCPKNFFKYWWDQELDQLKADSIKTNNIWKEAGKPKHGQIFVNRTNSRFLYRKKLRECQRLEDESYTNELHSALMAKNGVRFWKCWQSKFDSKIKINGVGGHSCAQQIANNFQIHFSALSEANNPVMADSLQSEFNRRIACYCGYPISSIKTTFTTEAVSKIIDSLSKGKAAGLDGITAEHVMYCCPILSCILAKLFNLMLQFCYVPLNFCLSFTVPLPKAKDVYSKSLTSDDFRGIAISCLLSKIFEHCIVDSFANYFKSSDNQFGFKKQLGCTSAIYSIRKIIDFHLHGGSSVNICSVDISKAFDKTNHHGLLIKLMNRQTPVEIIKLLHFWLSNSLSCIKWDGCYSTFYRLKFGVRQGSVLSPVLFAIYLDDIHQPTLKSWYSVILYADDILIVSSSLKIVQEQFLHWQTELLKLDLTINAKKSCCLRIGPRFRSQCVNILTNDGGALPWVDKIRYLGIFIVSAAAFRCCLDHAKSSFFRSTNAIFGKVGRLASEEVVLQLIQSKCLPVLLYATEVCALPRHALSSLDFVFKRFLMKLFRTGNISIIDDSITYFNLSTPQQAIHCRQEKFLKKFSALSNSICVLARQPTL